MGRISLLGHLVECTKGKKFESSSYDRKTYLVLSNFETGYGTISCTAKEHMKSNDSIIVSTSKIYPNLLDLVEYIPKEQILPK